MKTRCKILNSEHPDVQVGEVHRIKGITIEKEITSHGVTTLREIYFPTDHIKIIKPKTKKK